MHNAEASRPPHSPQHSWSGDSRAGTKNTACRKPPSESKLGRSDRWRELSPQNRRGQGRASHQNSGYRAGGRTSEVTVTDSEPREEPVTRPSLREYAAVQRERYLAATRAEKGTLLNEVVTVTGLHRKAAIRLLRRPPRAPTARSRAGRPPVYGSAVA